MHMPEKLELYEHKLRADSPRQILKIISALIFADVAQSYGWLPYFPAFILIYAVAYLIDYWIPPRPPENFFVWMVKVILLMGYMLLGVWLAPRLLSRWIWIPLAYGIPVLLLALSTYWIPPLYPVKREESFRKTMIWSIVFAVLIAVGVTYSSKYR